MNPLLTPKQVAQILSLSYRAILQMIALGDLSAYRVGNSYRIHEGEVRQFLENNKFKSGWKK